MYSKIMVGKFRETFQKMSDNSIENAVSNFKVRVVIY